MAITPERASSIEYSFPVMEDGIRLLQKKKNATALDYVKPLVFNEVATLSIVTLIACSLLFSVALHFNEQGSCSFISRQDFPKKATTILRTAASFIAGSSIQNEAQKTSSIPLWTVAGITRACLIALLTAGITKGLISETNPVKFAPVAKRDNWLDPHKRYGVIEGSAEEEFLKIFEEKIPGDYRFIAEFPNTSRLAEALSDEQVDYAFIQASVADEIMTENRFKGLFTTDEDEASLNIPHALGYNKNLDPSIRSVINQGIIHARFRNEIKEVMEGTR